MNLWQALLLGVVQGLTEFLPISSSGHLVLTNFLLGVSNDTIVFEISVHLGSLVAVLVYFRRDLAMVVVDFFRGGAGRHVGWMLLLAMIPTAIIGLVFKQPLESLFHAPRFASMGLLFTAAVLFSSEKVKRGERPLEQVRWRDALLIGTLQGLAIMPGVSRSGSTIAAGLFAGLTRDAAARFSFLLSIPAILGAGVVTARDFVEIEPGLAMPSLVGAVAAGISGYVAIGLLMHILRTGRLYVFVGYTLLVGILGLVLLP